MRKQAFLDRHYSGYWPNLAEVRRYFSAPAEQQGSLASGHGSVLLSVEGVNGTAQLELGKGRIDIELSIWANPKHGVVVIYSKCGPEHRVNYSSQGDLSRLHEFVRSNHGTRLPVGLFIPLEKACEAVKEFIETDGALPKSIEWIANRDLPPNSFPGP